MTLDSMKEGFARKQAELIVVRLKEINSLVKKTTELRNEVKDLNKMIRSTGFDPKILLKELGFESNRKHSGGRKKGMKKDGENRDSGVVGQD